MKVHVQTKTTDEMTTAIQTLDLDPIKFKLMDRDEGHGWTRQYADRMAVEYKRFLTLIVKYPNESIAPNKEVDKFWHGHILDTLKYAEDCQRVFGYFLHHFPYFGMRGDEDAKNLAQAGKTMRALYEKEFGEQSNSASSYCGVAAVNASTSLDAAGKSDAYCGAAAGKSDAYCGVAAGKNDAYCGAVAGKSDAYCGVAAGKSDAYCGAVAAKSVAYCGAATAESDAYCGAAATQTSYCGIAMATDDTSSEDAVRASAVLDVAKRPTL